jgi:hypothetical protein
MGPIMDAERRKAWDGDPKRQILRMYQERAKQNLIMVSDIKVLEGDGGIRLELTGKKVSDLTEIEDIQAETVQKGVVREASFQTLVDWANSTGKDLHPREDLVIDELEERRGKLRKELINRGEVLREVVEVRVYSQLIKTVEPVAGVERNIRMAEEELGQKNNGLLPEIVKAEARRITAQKANKSDELLYVLDEADVKRLQGEIEKAYQELPDWEKRVINNVEENNETGHNGDMWHQHPEKIVNGEISMKDTMEEVWVKEMGLLDELFQVDEEDVEELKKKAFVVWNELKSHLEGQDKWETALKIMAEVENTMEQMGGVNHENLQSKVDSIVEHVANFFQTGNYSEARAQALAVAMVVTNEASEVKKNALLFKL